MRSSLLITAIFSVASVALATDATDATLDRDHPLDTAEMADPGSGGGFSGMVKRWHRGNIWTNGLHDAGNEGGIYGNPFFNWMEGGLKRKRAESSAADPVVQASDPDSRDQGFAANVADSNGILSKRDATAASHLTDRSKITASHSATRANITGVVNGHTRVLVPIDHPPKPRDLSSDDNPESPVGLRTKRSIDQVGSQVAAIDAWIKYHHDKTHPLNRRDVPSGHLPQAHDADIHGSKAAAKAGLELTPGKAGEHPVSPFGQPDGHGGVSPIRVGEIKGAPHGAAPGS